jgi:multiple sugar transport system permease protein
MLVLAITIFPLSYLIRTSFYKWELTKPQDVSFYGIRNYIKLLSDDFFINSIQFTVILVFGAVLGQTVLALFFSEILNTNFLGRNVFRTLLILPMVIAPIVVGVLWKMLLHPNLGVINHFLQLIFGVKIAWLRNTIMARSTIIMVDIWQWTPFVLLILLASYTTVPINLYESAEIDGANPHFSYALNKKPSSMI